MKKINQNCNMVSFKVKLPSTSVSLEYTIDIIIKRIFEDREIIAILKKSELKKHLTLFKRIATSHLTTKFIYKLITDIFMVELETTVFPKLEDHVKKWRRFLDDTIAYVKTGSVEYVLSVLNSFYKNIKFTYEEEQNNALQLLDVLFIRDSENLNTNVYGKERHSDLYRHWNSFSPIRWKRRTLKSLIRRAYMVCLSERLLEKEPKYLKNVFHKVNGYPGWVIDQVCKFIQENINKNKSFECYLDTSEQPVEKMHP